MGKGFAIFWIVFISYFIFAHPAIIYYNTSFESTDLMSVSPHEAFFFLALSFALWFTVFFVTMRLILKYTYVAKRNIRNLLQHGKRLRAQIVEVKVSQNRGNRGELKTLLLELENFEGETIWHTVSFTDSRPDENRYLVGKTCYLRVDPSFSKTPSVVPEDSQATINKLFFVLWALFLAAVLYYFSFSYQLESAGYGWRFLSLWHPLIVIPACFLFFPGIIFLFLKFLIFKKMNIGSEMTMLKFNGKKALARIIQSEQTGTSINDQPEVRFKVQFQDKSGRTVSTVIKKIVSLLDIGQINTEREKTIFYDPNNPQFAAFEKDINQR